MSAENYNKKIILIVDDEPVIRKLIAREFDKGVFEILQAEDGLKASEILQNVRVDVVISDVRMPRLNGAELLQWISKNMASRPPKIFMISGFSDFKKQELTDLGALQFFDKPFIFKELYRSVLKSI